MNEPCESCKRNERPNCGNDYCHTNQNNWIVDCGSCGGKSEVTWKKAINDGCPICCSWKIQIYSKKNVKKDSEN